MQRLVRMFCSSSRISMVDWQLLLPILSSRRFSILGSCHRSASVVALRIAVAYLKKLALLPLFSLLLLFSKSSLTLEILLRVLAAADSLLPCRFQRFTVGIGMLVVFVRTLNALDVIISFCLIVVHVLIVVIVILEVIVSLNFVSLRSKWYFLMSLNVIVGYRIAAIQLR